MINNDIYYKKYLKYKKKYTELKGQIGGECPSSKEEYTKAQLIKLGCTKDKFEISSIKKKEIDTYNNDKTDKITINDLINARFTVKELKDAGFTIKELKDAGFTIKDIVYAGFEATALKEEGFTCTKLKEAYIDVLKLKHIGFTCQDIKDAGFPLKYIKGRAIYSPEELESCGYSLKDLLDNEFNLFQLANTKFPGSDYTALHITREQLVSEGYNEEKLKELGF